VNNTIKKISEFIIIVAYRHVDKQLFCKTGAVSGPRLSKHFPVAGQQILIMQQLEYNNGNGVFSMRSVSRCYKQGTKIIESLVEFCMEGCGERT
jgi:hypothetical protein